TPYPWNPSVLFWRHSAGTSGNLLNAAPGMFVNAAVADLHLLPSAINAIDKASTLSTVTNDFDGERRPRGAGFDIGADEFSSVMPPTISSISHHDNDVVVRFNS